MNKMDRSDPQRCTKTTEEGHLQRHGILNDDDLMITREKPGGDIMSRPKKTKPQAAPRRDLLTSRPVAMKQTP